MGNVRVVFLDFDGVLNSTAFALRVPHKGLMGLDPEAVARLNSLEMEIEEDVCFVVSSTWRFGRTLDQLRRILHEAGFTGIVAGKTPELNKPRGLEIQAWLDSAPLYGIEVEQFVILDDDSDMEHLGDRLVKTSFQDGLQDEHVERVKVLLAEPKRRIVAPPKDFLARFERDRSRA